MIRVGIFEGVAGGHHDQYVRELAKSLRCGGLQVERLDTEMADTQWGLWALVLASRSKWKSFDVVHYTYADPIVVPLAYLIRRKNPLVSPAVFATVHWYTAVDGSRKSIAYQVLKQAALRVSSRALNGIFVHGPVGRSIIKKIVGPDARVVEIPYGTTVHNRTSVGGGRTVLFFGGLRKDKGLEFLARALHGFPDDYRLIVAGEPLDYDESAIRGMFDNDRTRYELRYIAEEEVEELFGSATTLILPYVDSFGGQSGPLTIAASYGVPVIGTRVGEVGTTIADFGLGETIPAGDIFALRAAVRTVFGYDKDRRSQIAKNGRDYAVSHSWAVMGQTVAQTYRSVSRGDQSGGRL